MISRSDIRYLGLQEESAVLAEKIEKQVEDIDAQKAMHSILGKQIEQGADRVDAIGYDNATIKELFESVQRRAYKLRTENEEMEAKIQAIQNKVRFFCSMMLHGRLGRL